MNTKTARQPIRSARHVVNSLLLLLCLVFLLSPSAQALANGQLAPRADASPGDLISAMNSLRVANGFKPLIEDATIDAVAQSTAAIMAANNMSWHIGNVSGRLQSAGYGGGGKVFATENFVAGFTSLDQIMQAWADPSHMLPAVTGAYCNVGAGMATSPKGLVYYVLQAAYVSGKSCGSYTSGGGSSGSGSSSGAGAGSFLPIIPVKVAEADADGRIFHVVQAGQTLWAIAIAYKVTIADLVKWNNLSTSSTLLVVGQKLFIPGSNTEGYATPTPVGFVITSTPDADGKVVHVIQAYQNLSAIADAYNISVDTILRLNNLKIDTPLQIGQKLLIVPSQVTPSPTPRPLTPLEKLTPASDGKYYHVVKSGENLSWIAALYKITAAQLIEWNKLAAGSVLQPGQKLLLQVTPPATVTPTVTITYTPGPPTATATPAPPTVTPTEAPSPTITLTATASPPPPPVTASDWPAAIPLAVGVLALAAAGILLFVYRRKKES